jgi:hypothetical protein
MGGTGGSRRLSVVMNVHNRCNLRCRFCFEEGERLQRNPPLEEIREMLRGVDPGSANNVMFMASETLLRRDALDIIRMVRDLGFSNIGVATNATLLHRRDRLEALLQAGLSVFELSIHTLDPAHAEYLSQRKFTHARQIRCLELMESLRSRFSFLTTINTVVCATNLGDVTGLIRGIEERFPGLRSNYHIKYTQAIHRLEGKVELATWRMIRDAGLMSGIPERLHPRVTFENFPLCILSPHFFLSADLVDFINASSYWFVFPEAEGSVHTSDGLTSHPRGFASVCQECRARFMCCGVEPFYLRVHPEEDAFVPVEVDAEVILRNCIEWRKNNGLDVDSDLAGDVDRAVGILKGVFEKRGHPCPPEPGENPILEERPAPSGPSQRRFHQVLESYSSRFNLAGLESREILSMCGTPPCCIEAFLGGSASPAERMEALFGEADTVSWKMNPFLRASPFHLFRHIPCSQNCGKTLEAGERLLKEILAGNRSLHDDLVRYCRGPVLCTGVGGIWIPFDGQAEPRGIRYREPLWDKGFMEDWHGWGVPGSGDYRFLEDLVGKLLLGDSLALDRNGLEVRKGGRLIAKVSRPERARWKICDFV